MIDYQIVKKKMFFGPLIENIEGSKLACDTGGHFTNYPTWPLPRTNPHVDVLNNSLNCYQLLCFSGYDVIPLVCKHKIYNSMFTDVLAVTPHINKRPELITCSSSRIFRVAVYLHNSSSDMVNIFFTALALIAENRDISYVDNDIFSRERPYLRRHTSAAVVFASLNSD